MLSNKRHRQHQSFLETSKFIDVIKQSTSGTLSPETTTTTSSGYSTGGSSVSTRVKQSLKKSSLSSSSSTTRKEHNHHQQQQQQQQQQKTKSKGLRYLLTKLKNLVLPTKTKTLHLKPMRSATSRQISSSNILRQYHQQSPIYDLLPSSSSLTTSNAISLPFTYYYNSPIRQSKANFEKIAAWLNHTEKLIKNQHNNSNDILSIDANHHHQQQSTVESSNHINNQGITVVMKKTPINIKPPKRSSSLVTRIIRPQIIEQQLQKTLSPSSSFSSSILTKEMSDRITSPSPIQKSDNHLSSKSNRHRTINFSRRRTIDGINEHKSNKENISIKNLDKSFEDIYQFPTVSTKKYYFHHSNSTKPNEDLLNNSYGLTLLQQQQQPPPPSISRTSAAVAAAATTAALMISQVPNQVSSQKQQFTPRTSLKQHTMESLDDLLCDREVESYFYPTSSSSSEHIYMNLENSSQSLSSIHGTLC